VTLNEWSITIGESIHGAITMDRYSELTIFEDREHERVARPRPPTDRAREMVKAFIVRQLSA
jgi:hypothetical protein